MNSTQSPAMEPVQGRSPSQARVAIARGDLSQALSHFVEAGEIARRLRSEEMAQTALCNVCAMKLETGDAVPLARLRELTSSGCSPRVRMLAALNLSTAYHYDNQTTKGAFYAQLAYQIAARSDAQYRARCAYQLGLLRLARYQLEDACSLLEEALADGLVDIGAEPLAVSTLGYCYGLSGSVAAALDLLDEGIRGLEREGCWYYLTSAQLNKGFLLLELGDAEAASDLADQVLAHEQSEGGDRKHALFLGGESAARQEHFEAAASYFRALQREYYPEARGALEILLRVRTHSLVNWLA